MDLTPRIERYDPPGARPPRRVRVPNRDDVGTVIGPSQNFGGGDHTVRGVTVHFPDTGEILFYAVDRVADAG